MISALSCFSQRELNVKNFGAKGNGVSDDTEAILNCLKEAVNQKTSTIIIPYGTYKISKSLDVYYTDNSLTIKGISEKGKKPVIFSTSNLTILSLRGYAFKDNSQGSATIENIKLVGSNVPYSLRHPLINKSKFYYGIYIADKNKAVINNVEVENIYGEGIGIISTDIEMAGEGRFAFVSVKNSKILNCWGYHPAKDDYGDGIYITNTQRGEVINNVISNQINITKQFGRGGIVLEWLADNILVEKNVVSGYDRGLHIEGTGGGQQIINNVFTGSDLGIVLYEYPIPGHKNRPIIIRGNTVNNDGFMKNTKVDRVRKPRSMLNFLATDNSRVGSIIENNVFHVNENYQFEGNTIANILSDNLTFRNNVFSIINSKALSQPMVLNDLGKNNKFINNTLKSGVLLKR